MKKLNLLKKLVKGTAAGGITGYSASFVTSTPTEEDKNSIRGLQVGAALGAGMASAIPIARSKTLRKAGKAAGKVIFRRIGGRVVPIRR